MERLIVAHTPLADDRLLFSKLTGSEQLSGLYCFEVELLSASNDIDIKSLLGQAMTVALNTHKETPRYLNGCVTQITLVGRETTGERYYVWLAVLRPALWYLTQNRDFRIWQEKSVPEIITELLAEHHIPFDNQLSWRYRRWNYCVQYQESDFDFISRLMEHEGIYYYFHHQLGSEVFVLADAPEAHGSLPGYEKLAYHPCEEQVAEAITRWSVTDSITPALYSHDDYDYRQPDARLLEVRQNPHSFAAGKAEVFDWPGGFTDREHGEFYARVRQQEFAARHQQISGSASALGIGAGYRFNFTQAPRPVDEGDYLTISASYKLVANAYASGSDQVAEQRINFVVVPAAVNWRPARTTRWPKTHGPQTAVVVGPRGETLWTDQYGRVKLKFRWDRHGRDDETASCWVRVSSYRAGWKYGAVQVPRIGEEVVVDFINGDPDRPIITGGVYNQQNMPPWDLPSAATRMGFMSRSSGGTMDNASFLYLDDAPGRESFAMHAERDMTISVENNLNLQVDSNSRYLIKGNRSTEVLADDDLTIDGNRHIFTKGGYSEQVVGPVSQVYQQGLLTEISSAGKKEIIHGEVSVSIEGGWQQNVSGGDIAISSPNNIHLESDSNIAINAPSLTFTTRGEACTLSGVNIGINGLDIKVNGMTAGTTLSSNEVKGVASSITGFNMSKSVVSLQTDTIKYSGSGVKLDYSSQISIFSMLHLYM
ncbi:type VI secretion system Vgr family protein [Winslowiella iniecta]|uniref:Uncharacterized protein n=1 Tax=Winslowiella iniecta TaxID=1560201 RepID=A0A0L7T0M9_9GAMM|nr:type VI secretion system tip protein TssI/VgrG [Winslowiella iniecta]KOC88888.1 hypothetical protein NG42_14640 [Winslowiella iniecta]KOC92296.1 hypothetical protein NG43_14065 [Winslowiella iniecta]